MKTIERINKLSRMKETINASLDELLVAGNGEYEYSSSIVGPRSKKIEGRWRVTKHTVDGEDYLGAYANGKFGEGNWSNGDYDSTFEFTRNVCVKRMMIGADVIRESREKTIHFDYRMSLAFMFEIRKSLIVVLPMLGYQQTLINGDCSEIRELPSGTEWMSFGIEFLEQGITITDKQDIKVLGRIAE